MSDENDNGNGGEGDGGGKAKAAPKTIEVVVLRAVDGYHHRNAQLTVPNDEYHRGLLKQGNLRELA